MATVEVWHIFRSLGAKASRMEGGPGSAGPTEFRVVFVRRLDADDHKGGQSSQAKGRWEVGGMRRKGVGRGSQGLVAGDAVRQSRRHQRAESHVIVDPVRASGYIAQKK